MDKDALVKVAYNETGVSSCATMRHNNILNHTLIFLAHPFYASVSKGAASIIFYTFLGCGPTSNPLPPAPKADAQPTELSRRSYGLS